MGTLDVGGSINEVGEDSVSKGAIGEALKLEPEGPVHRRHSVHVLAVNVVVKIFRKVVFRGKNLVADI
jgi:hypothetical protein